MKKLTRFTLSLALILVMLFSLVGCSTSNTANGTSTQATSAFPKGPITWVVPWKPGGANDISARLIAPELEKQLGVPVTITNTEGAGGWIGYNMMLTAKADGYTISSISLPGMVASYLNPETKRSNTYKDFAPLVNFARDYVVIAIRPDENRFTNFKELYEYSKKNEVSIAGTSGAGDDAILIAQLNSIEGAQFVQLGTGGASESLTNLYGKHADVTVANVSEVGNPIKAGQLKVIAVAAEQRVPSLPDVPTINEEVGVKIVVDSSRGIATSANVPEEVLTKLRDALTKALESKELQTKLAEQGIDVELTDWKGYTEIMKNAEDTMYELGPKYFGWDIKK